MSGLILGILGKWGGIIAEFIVAIATVGGLFFTWWQLHVLKKTNSGTFIHDLYKDFYTEDASHLIELLKGDKLKIVQKVDAAHIADRTRETYTEHEIVTHLLDPLEHLGSLAERKLVRIDLIYDFFSWYINLIWTNAKIQAYIEQTRKNPDDWDLFIRLEKLHYQCKVYGDRGTLLHDRDLLSKRAGQLGNRVWLRSIWPLRIWS